MDTVDHFGEVEDGCVEVPAWLASAARPVTAAGALIRNDRGEVLIVEPTYKPTWEIPGGLVETGESPAAACQREVHEELGLSAQALVLGRLLCIDWSTRAPGQSAMRLVYDGGVLGDLGAIRLPAAELASAQFAPLAVVDRLCAPVLGQRVRAAVEAKDRGCVLELDDGRVRR